MKVAVIFGGKSPEHEVSRVSAVTAVKWLESAGYDVIKIGITKKGRWYLTDAGYDEMADGSWEQDPGNLQVVIPHDPEVKGVLVFDRDDRATVEKVDCFVPMLHGAHGEDGDIQGLFELAEVPYVGSGVSASADCMDKSIAKIIAATTGVDMAKHCVVEKYDYERDPEAAIEWVKDFHRHRFPLFVKPSSAGSSVGASKVKCPKDLGPAFDEAFRYDDKLLAEEAIVGREFEVAVMGNHEPKASCVGEILSAGEFYDYESKYVNAESKTRVVDDISKDILDEIREYACAIYKALGCRGLSRVDFFYSHDDRIVFNEVNTLPGFTSISMYPKLWDHMGVDGPELMKRLVDLAIENQEEKHRVQ